MTALSQLSTSLHTNQHSGKEAISLDLFKTSLLDFNAKAFVAECPDEMKKFIKLLSPEKKRKLNPPNFDTLFKPYQDYFCSNDAIELLCDQLNELEADGFLSVSDFPILTDLKIKLILKRPTENPVILLPSGTSEKGEIKLIFWSRDYAGFFIQTFTMAGGAILFDDQTSCTEKEIKDLLESYLKEEANQSVNGLVPPNKQQDIQEPTEDIRIAYKAIQNKSFDNQIIKLPEEGKIWKFNDKELFLTKGIESNLRCLLNVKSASSENYEIMTTHIGSKGQFLMQDKESCQREKIMIMVRKFILGAFAD